MLSSLPNASETVLERKMDTHKHLTQMLKTLALELNQTETCLRKKLHSNGSSTDVEHEESRPDPLQLVERLRVMEKRIHSLQHRAQSVVSEKMVTLHTYSLPFVLRSSSLWK